jgi:gliding motility associated protien GldN
VSDEKTGYHSYIPYPYVSEDDILWAKRVTKKIDTRMLQNHPLYFPIDVTHTGYKLSSNGSPVGVKFNEVISGIDARKNLYQILYDAATTIDPSTGRPLVSTYNISMTRRYENDEVVPDFENGFAGAFGYRVEIPAEDDGDEPFIAYAPYEANQVLYYLIDEEVFFDKKRSKLDYRYVSITAVIIDESNEPKALPTFYFPEIRHLLSNHKIFPLNGNMAQRISFDEFFHRKAFASNIVKETNVYDRRIDTYLPTSLEQLLEGERIKEQIRRYESDMWNY